jgi:hypothetical protein
MKRLDVNTSSSPSILKEFEELRPFIVEDRIGTIIKLIDIKKKKMFCIKKIIFFVL